MSSVFRHEQVVRVPPDRAVAFFHDVRNLKQVSPRFPSLEILGSNSRVLPGAVIPVQLTVGPVQRTLYTRILRVEEDGSFTDSLDGGPFAHWEHTHRFEPVEGGTRLIDEIVYTPRTWARPLAGLALRIMFLIRRRAIGRVLG